MTFPGAGFPGTRLTAPFLPEKLSSAQKMHFWTIFVFSQKPKNLQETASKKVCRALDPTVSLGERNITNENLPGAQKDGFLDDFCFRTKTKMCQKKILKRVCRALDHTVREHLLVRIFWVKMDVF